MEPQYDYTNAQVYVVAEFPETWIFTGSWYTGSVGGVPVSGPGTLLSSDPGVCSSMGPVPEGYERVFLADGPFPSLSPETDHAEAQLTFNTGSTDGTYLLRFWTHLVDVGGETCDDDNPLSVLQSESPEWEQIVGASVPVAFGDHFWGVLDGSVDFAGAVYVQVLTPNDAQVWRSSDLRNWEQAFDWVWPPMSLEAPRFSQPAVLGHRLFVGLSDSDQGPYPDACRVWSTGDGLVWELSLEEDPPCRLHALFEFQGLVYAALDSPLRLVGTADGSSWNTIAEFPPDAYWIYATQQVDGAMYLGGWSVDPEDCGLWRFDGSGLLAVGQALGSCDWIASMTTFRDELYVGCFGPVGQGQIWSSPDGESWQLVVDDGFGGGGAGDRRVAGLASHRGRLFAWSDGPGGNLWSTIDLVNWEGSLLSQVIRDDGSLHLETIGPHLFFSSKGELWSLRPLFADGFETGDLTAWSQSVP